MEPQRIGLVGCGYWGSNLCRVLAQHPGVELRWISDPAPKALEKARRIMQELNEVGIDMDAVTLQLQHEGVKSFADSYDQLIQTLEQRRKALARA